MRRAKLYYLRDRHGKAAKIKERRVPRGKAAQPPPPSSPRRPRRGDVEEEVIAEELDEVELDEIAGADAAADVEAAADEPQADVVDMVDETGDADQEEADG